MQQRNRIQSAMRNPKSAIGFTLVELLVVIGIIVLLIGILLPVVAGVRKSAYAAASAQQISRLTAGIEAYYGEHNAYPGPLSHNQIVLGASLPGIKPPASGKTVPPLKGVTMSENLVLGVVGGLEPATGSVLGVYSEDRISSRLGVMGLNPIAPKGSRPYIEVSSSELSLLQGDAKPYQSEYGGPAGGDSPIPEFVDHFPDSLPVLYYRARRGAPGVISDKGVGAKAYQYDVQQNRGYLEPTAPPKGYGIGGTGPHGLTKVPPELLLNSPSPPPTPEAPWGVGGSGGAPYGAFTYFANPQLTAVSLPRKNEMGTPRQKDGYILISPGKDRVYGTRDDITNFGPIQ